MTGKVLLAACWAAIATVALVTLPGCGDRVSLAQSPARQPRPDERLTKMSGTPDGRTPAPPPVRKSTSKLRTGKHSDVPFDPVKENGPIFVNWPKPQSKGGTGKLAIVITGMERGYIEPCGCAGMDRMKGGIGRRYALFQQLRRDGWPVIGLDVGGLIHGYGQQAVLKFQALVDAKLKTGYNAVAFGADDLRLPAADLLSRAASVDDKPSLFVDANVGLFEIAAGYTATSRVVEAGGVKVGVTGILGASYKKDLHNAEIEMIDPAVALVKIVPELKRKADFLILLAHATHEESIALAKKFPQFAIVVTSDGPPEPPKSADLVPGTRAPLITVGHKGAVAIVLGVFDEKNKGRLMRYQRVPLDSRFDGPPPERIAPEMKAIMAAYQDQLKFLGFGGLGLPEVPHPQAETNGRFVASKQCQNCHEKSYDIWKKSKHAEAFDTLVKLDPPRHYDPECISCHVVGWRPDKFIPYTGGFQSKEKTPDLVGVGCDACHGPGEKHIAAEMGNNEALQQALRKAVRLTKAEAKKQFCVTCHDGDNSFDFNFDTYWPEIEHSEKDQ